MPGVHLYRTSPGGWVFTQLCLAPFGLDFHSELGHYFINYTKNCAVIENFTPISALIGGGLIGLSSAFLLVLSGRVAGVSGIIAGLLPPAKGETAWRLWFLGGLILGTGLYRIGTGDGVETLVFDATMPMIVIGGLMTGVGTRVGGGCTSGHGVCGIGRVSPRSIAATLTFIAAGAVVVYINRHVLGV